MRWKEKRFLLFFLFGWWAWRLGLTVQENLKSQIDSTQFYPIWTPRAETKRQKNKQANNQACQAQTMIVMFIQKEKEKLRLAHWLTWWTLTWTRHPSVPSQAERIAQKLLWLCFQLLLWNKKVINLFFYFQNFFYFHKTFLIAMFSDSSSSSSSDEYKPVKGKLKPSMT